MAHFAQLDENNIVTQVIVVSNDDVLDENKFEVEEVGINFCKKLFGNDTNWKQTSYNGRIRRNYAGVGYSYDAELDVFVPPQPYPSWTFDVDTVNWTCPLGNPPQPTDEERAAGSYYTWDEDAYQADNTTGWVLVTPE